ncbi:LTA synthase family protein, partial [Klebsiella pneumoniae]|nr:LTA synthase family protein [Klebsiella pneumoniae]
KAGAWGVPDGFMFRFASDRLEKARKKGEKVFILMLSTTNHGPYLVPKSYHGADFEIPEKALKRFPLPDIRQMFRTFRYANDMLGTFIS